MDKILNNEESNNIIIDLIQSIDEFSVIIYKMENNKSYELLLNIIDKLELIVSKKSTFLLENNFKIYINEINNKLANLLEAFENIDNVLISDILKYDIKPLLENLIKM